MSKKARGLGRGLDALLGAEASAEIGSDAREPATLSLAVLQPGKYQPRSHMDQAALAELADSIRVQGVMQPILVRPLAGTTPQRYEIIAGERRFRAAKIAGLAEVPVIVKDVPDNAALAMALIENIQREDLNPLEEAQGVQRLIREFEFTHEQAATAIGRSRSATSNLLRLLNLAAPVQQMLLEGRLEMGHARALLAVDAAVQIQLAQNVFAQKRSVRDTEALVARSLNPKTERAASKKKRSRDVVALEEQLADVLGAPVSIAADAKGRGKLVIGFSSLDQLDGIVERLRRA